MTRDQLIDCLKGKEGQPISIRHTCGVIMGVFEKIIWDVNFPRITGVKLDVREEPFKPVDIIEINDAPGYTSALKIMRMMNRGGLG